jgi:hypothetical protein
MPARAPRARLRSVTPTHGAVTETCEKMTKVASKLPFTQICLEVGSDYATKALNRKRNSRFYGQKVVFWESRLPTIPTLRKRVEGPYSLANPAQTSPPFVTGLTVSCEAPEVCLGLQSKEFWAQYGVARTAIVLARGVSCGRKDVRL